MSFKWLKDGKSVQALSGRFSLCTLRSWCRQRKRKCSSFSVSIKYVYYYVSPTVVADHVAADLNTTWNSSLSSFSSHNNVRSFLGIGRDLLQQGHVLILVLVANLVNDAKYLGND